MSESHPVKCNCLECYRARPGGHMALGQVVVLPEPPGAEIIIQAQAQPKKESILEEALRVTHGPRQAQYGHPSVNWARTAEIASAITGVSLTPAQCVMVAIAMKLGRLRETENHRDSMVDLAGYAWVLSEVVGA